MTDTVQPLRPPGTAPPEAGEVALARLMEAMIMSSTILRAAGDCYRMALKIALVSAPYGQHGVVVERILQAAMKRLEAHLATLPADPPRPPDAA